jgi:hypothetical protein
VPGGITSGPKKNCLPGPNWSCINEDQSLGEYLFDSTNWRPGISPLSLLLSLFSLTPKNGLKKDCAWSYLVVYHEDQNLYDYC